MIIFLLALCGLILGYFIYGKFVEKIMGADSSKKMPATRICDKVDFVELPTYKIFLIQFLNIAGLGPVFGAILGALYGPVALFWIVLGSIFAGGVHDYMSGRISMHFRGQSIVCLVEKFFGKHIKVLFFGFLTLFLLLLGAVFAMSPAHMLADLTSKPFILCLGIIFGYYFLATLLPIDKIIGKFYPLFALLLLGITLALGWKMMSGDIILYPIRSLKNLHPDNLPIFPLMFITIACGALSGFHATQSPMMARCLTNEKKARAVFYGAMITEGIVALIWATLGMSYYQDPSELLAVVNKGTPGAAISEISTGLIGSFGGSLAVISVIVLSITSGDTAFRSARLNFADIFHISQTKISKRLILSSILLGGGIALSFFNVNTIWIYFGWSNQMLATITLWVSSLYLAHRHKLYLITLVPAVFMTAVCITYIFYEKIGFGLPIETAKILGAIVATLGLIAFGIGQYLTKKR